MSERANENAMTEMIAPSRLRRLRTFVRSRLAWGRIYRIDQLPQVRAVDGPARRHRGRADVGADDPRARHVAAVESRRARAGRRDGALSDRHHADAIVPRVHVRLIAGGDPGGGRPADAADHRHDTACATTSCATALVSSSSRSCLPSARSTGRWRRCTNWWRRSPGFSALPASQTSCSSSTTRRACCGRSASSPGSATRAWR